MGISTMFRPIAGLLLVLPLALSDPAFAEPAPGLPKARAPAVSYEVKKREANDIAVTLVVTGIACTCARFAEDMRNVVNTMGSDGIRVLPVIGSGGLQNLRDVLFLKNMDMAIIDEDNMELLAKAEPSLNISQHVQLITKLYNSEFQVLARSDIKSMDDLKGKKVNFSLKDSQTQVTAATVLDGIGVRTQPSYYDNDEALSRLRSGELAAMIILTGAPQATYAGVKVEDGLHFLALDQDNLPGRDTSAVFAKYLPTELTHAQYPKLIPEGETVPTIAGRALLVAYTWPEGSERYKRVSKFVDAFFNKIDQFNSPSRHPKWKEVNLSAEIPGWTRYKPAADWLAAHHAQTVAAARGSDDLRPAFDRFMQNYAVTTGRRTPTPQERESLYAEFSKMIADSKSRQATR